jgi:insertion element IS1 protein InsB
MSGAGWPSSGPAGVAWFVGQRNATTAQRLWQALPAAAGTLPTCGSYVGILHRRRHRRCPKGDGGTSIVEAVSYALRQRCGVLVRKSCSFSKSLEMHQARIKIIIDHYNITLN